MHEIEPFYNWYKYYNVSEDKRSPYFGKEYNLDLYSEAIYNYYIDPAWDSMGSETLYIKILFADYDKGFAVIEFIGEWNDALYNDIMHLKRNIIEHMLQEGLNKFILIGENVMNFHGSDDCYYEEWFEEVEDGWIAALNFRGFIQEEWKKFNIDSYINFGGTLEVINWRTMPPLSLFELINSLISRRLSF